MCLLFKGFVKNLVMTEIMTTLSLKFIHPSCSSLFHFIIVATIENCEHRTVYILHAHRDQVSGFDDAKMHTPWSASSNGRKLINVRFSLYLLHVRENLQCKLSEVGVFVTAHR